jgi:hypothetical protein
MNYVLLWGLSGLGVKIRRYSLHPKLLIILISLDTIVLVCTYLYIYVFICVDT